MKPVVLVGRDEHGHPTTPPGQFDPLAALHVTNESREVIAGMRDGDPVSHALIMAIWMAIFKMSPERRTRVGIQSPKRKGDGWTTRVGRLTVQVPRALLQTAAGLGPNPHTEVGTWTR
jgi:hypothetical protein